MEEDEFKSDSKHGLKRVRIEDVNKEEMNKASVSQYDFYNEENYCYIL